MTTLYRLWNREHALLYVGVTDDLERRMEQHEAEKPWWSEVSQTSTESLPSRRMALEAEARAIFWEQPRYNVLGSPRYSADWEARCHALEDAEAARLALPDLAEDDYKFLGRVLNAMAKDEDGVATAKRLYDLLDKLYVRGKPA